MPQNQKPKRFNKWMALVTIPTQMGAIIYLFSLLGSWLDENHPSSRIYYFKVLVMVGVVIALYNVIRQVNEINKSN